MIDSLLERAPYLLVVFLTAAGLFLMTGQRNLVKAVAGLAIFQSAVILFFIMIAFRHGATIPIARKHGDAAEAMINPLPHALMLTAIVVGVATLGMAMAILRRIQRETSSIEDTAEVDE